MVEDEGNWLKNTQLSTYIIGFTVVLLQSNIATLCVISKNPENNVILCLLPSSQFTYYTVT